MSAIIAAILLVSSFFMFLRDHPQLWENRDVREAAFIEAEETSDLTKEASASDKSAPSSQAIAGAPTKE